MRHVLSNGLEHPIESLLNGDTEVYKHLNYRAAAVLKALIKRGVLIYQPRMIDEKMAPNLYKTGRLNEKCFYSQDFLDKCLLKD